MGIASRLETQMIEIENIVLEFIYSDGITDFSYHLTEMPHMHMRYELHFIQAGECPVCVDDSEYILKKNTVCIIPPKTNHYFPRHSNKCEGFGMMLSVKYNKEDKHLEKSLEELERFLEFPKSVSIIEDNAKIESYMKDFISAYMNKKFGCDCMKRSALALIFFAILDELNGHKYLDHEITESVKRNDDFVLDTYIMRNYNRNVTLFDVSKILGYSVAHTGRIIKKNYGMPYSKLILELRMSRAQKSIISTNTSFAEIAQSVGYSSYNGFGMAFKRYFGKTPEQMRLDGK